MNKEELNYKTCKVLLPLLQKVVSQLETSNEKLDKQGIKAIKCKGYDITSQKDIDGLMESDLISSDTAIKLAYKLAHGAAADYNDKIEVNEEAVKWLRYQLSNMESNIRDYEYLEKQPEKRL